MEVVFLDTYKQAIGSSIATQYQHDTIMSSELLMSLHATNCNSCDELTIRKHLACCEDLERVQYMQSGAQVNITHDFYRQ